VACHSAKWTGAAPRSDAEAAPDELCRAALVALELDAEEPASVMPRGGQATRDRAG
jgi:hypothetical protein